MNRESHRGAEITTVSAVDGKAVSVAPDGATYYIPTNADIAAEFDEIKKRTAGKRVVVVQGLGFVGSAVAAVIAAARDPNGVPLYFVIGIDQAKPAAFWKIGKLNDGIPPVKSPDTEFDRLVAEGVREARNLIGTASEDAYSVADVIVVDVQLDVLQRSVQRPSDIQINSAAFESAIRVIGRKMRPDAMVMIETTVPFGFCENFIEPVLREERTQRGIRSPLFLAHAYERVMPGPRYVDSIRNFWRTFSGIDRASVARAREFLSSFINTEAFPLCELATATSSELAKILENSFRAANIALIQEWTILAERAGVNLWEIVDSIRVRKGTHDNLRYPGFGVGGYCLTKDSLLAQWALTHLFKSDHVLAMTLDALQINHKMPLHAVSLLEELFEGELEGKNVLICGVSYLPDVADTRNSPAEIFVEELEKRGVSVTAHDPSIAKWPERPEITIIPDFEAELTKADGIVFAVAHSSYRKFLPAVLQRPIAIVDASNVLSDKTASNLYRAGNRLAGVGKGHWRKAGYHLKI